MTMNNARLVAADQQRALIPDSWRIEFNDWTNEALLSLASDPMVAQTTRAYAEFEIEYRAAAGVFVDYSESGTPRRTSFTPGRPGELFDKLGDIEGDAERRKDEILKNWQGSGRRAVDLEGRNRDRMAGA